MSDIETKIASLVLLNFGKHSKTSRWGEPARNEKGYNLYTILATP